MHFYGWVIGDDIDTQQLVEESMAPWEEGVYQGDVDLWFQWDWYQIGGRFTGRLIPEYDPTKDPRNLTDDPFSTDGVKFPSRWAPYDGDVQIICDFHTQWMRSLADDAVPYCAFIHKAEIMPLVKWRYENGENVPNVNMRIEIEKILLARSRAGLASKIVVVDYHN